MQKKTPKSNKKKTQKKLFSSSLLLAAAQGWCSTQPGCSPRFTAVLGASVGEGFGTWGGSGAAQPLAAAL